jgi:hypothetical protein
LDEVVKIRWIDALLSGDYSQGTDRLRTGDRFCCLGVLCDLAAQEGIGQWSPINTNFHLDGKVFYGAIPHVVADWAGLEYEDRTPLLDHTEEGTETLDQLASMNDSGWTFQQIAEIVKDKL